MKMGYKLRPAGTDKNDWIIAVIYDVDGWPERSLKHSGISGYQFAREMTQIEKSDFEKSGTTRCTWVKYKDLESFVEDEAFCGVPKEFIEKVCKFYKDMTPNKKPGHEARGSSINRFIDNDNANI